MRVRVLRGNITKSEHVISESGPQTDTAGARMTAAMMVTPLPCLHLLFLALPLFFFPNDSSIIIIIFLL